MFNNILDTKNFFRTLTQKFDEILHFEVSNFMNFFEQFGSFILKPVCSGSSYGVQLIKSIEDIKLIFRNKLDQRILYPNHENLMVEPYIEGKELTVTVLEENKKSKAIEVTEIV